jgi:prevent-host-death family protein
VKTVSAADANRHFSKMLREVQGGETIIVTSRGMPVATLVPADRNMSVQNRAKKALLDRLRGQRPLNSTWTRDELYEDEP